MNPQDYLANLLENCSKHQLTADEKTELTKQGIEFFVYKKLTSKKFRKYKVDEACATRTKKSIQLKIQKNQAITVVYPQGGYKLWRFPSSPSVDWAEFFNLAYVLQYIAPIAKAYEPGVQLIYYLHTLLMELHDNLTTEEIQAYVDSFEVVIGKFRKYLPENISVSILRDADLYSRDEYFAALQNGRANSEKNYKTLPIAKKTELEKMAKLNIKWLGKEDWSVLSQTAKNEKIYLAAIYEMAASSQLTKVGEVVKSPANVLVFTKGTPDFIGIGSTKASIAKHWVGFGVLQKRADSFLPIILTPSQYQKAQKLNHQQVSIELIKLPNFDKIEVFNQSFTL